MAYLIRVVPVNQFKRGGVHGAYGMPGIRALHARHAAGGIPAMSAMRAMPTRPARANRRNRQNRREHRNISALFWWLGGARIAHGCPRCTGAAGKTISNAPYKRPVSCFGENMTE